MAAIDYILQLQGNQSSEPGTLRIPFDPNIENNINNDEVQIIKLIRKKYNFTFLEAIEFREKIRGDELNI